MECPACGGDGSEALTERIPASRFCEGATRYRIQRCAGCRTEFAEPRDTAPLGWYDRVGEFYGWRWEFDEALAALRSRPETRAVLEVGCGEGLLLARLASEYEAHGIDLNAEAVARARRKGMRAESADLDDFLRRHADLRLDAILFFHVLEHLDDPLRFLRSAHAGLAAGGRIMLSVPNERRLSLSVERETWDYPPHHLTRFSRGGIVKLLERAGFSVAALRDEPAGVSAYRWSATVANQTLRRLGLGEPMDWPGPVRRALKAPIVPLLCLQTYLRPERRAATTGTALFVVAVAVRDPVHDGGSVRTATRAERS